MHDAEREQLEERIRALESEIAVLRDVHNTPIVEPFALAAACEAKHQRLRHDHDARKDPWDWYWTLGYLGAKAARAHADGDIAKALHHTVTTAALLANWHRHLIAARPEAPATRKPVPAGASESMSQPVPFLSQRPTATKETAS